MKMTDVILFIKCYWNFIFHFLGIIHWVEEKKKFKGMEDFFFLDYSFKIIKKPPVFWKTEIFNFVLLKIIKH